MMPTEWWTAKISPQIVTIEDEPDQNLACVPMTLTIKKGSEPGEDEPYQNLACVPASLSIKKGFEPGENEPDQNLARVPATLNIRRGLKRLQSRTNLVGT
jgi:hypothetical protein